MPDEDEADEVEAVRTENGAPETASSSAGGAAGENSDDDDDSPAPTASSSAGGDGGGGGGGGAAVDPPPGGPEAEDAGAAKDDDAPTAAEEGGRESSSTEAEEADAAAAAAGAGAAAGARAGRGETPGDGGGGDGDGDGDGSGGGNDAASDGGAAGTAKAKIADDAAAAGGGDDRGVGEGEGGDDGVDGAGGGGGGEQGDGGDGDGDGAPVAFDAPFPETEMAKWDAVPFVPRFPNRPSKSAVGPLYAARRAALRRRERAFVRREAARTELDGARAFLAAAEEERGRLRADAERAADRARDAELEEPCQWNAAIVRLRRFRDAWGSFDVDAARTALRTHPAIVSAPDPAAAASAAEGRLKALEAFVRDVRAEHRADPRRMRELFPHRVRAVEALGLDWASPTWAKSSVHPSTSSPVEADDWNARMEQLREYKRGACGGGRTFLLDQGAAEGGGRLAAARTATVRGGGPAAPPPLPPPPPEGLARWVRNVAARYTAAVRRSGGGTAAGTATTTAAAEDEAELVDTLGPARTRALGELLRDDLELSLRTEDEKVEAVREFMERAGHCDHPHPEMKAWMGRMRTARRRLKREEEEGTGAAEAEADRATRGAIAKMDALGFCWGDECACPHPEDDEEEGALWSERLGRLRDHRARHGHCRVEETSADAPPPHVEAPKGSLVHFVRAVQGNYRASRVEQKMPRGGRKKRVGRKRKEEHVWPRLNAPRIDALRRIMHPQELLPEPAGWTFEQRLARFVEHRALTGHCVEPSERAQRWIDKMRLQRKYMLRHSKRWKPAELDADRVKRLDEAGGGLCWTKECRCFPAPPSGRWHSPRVAGTLSFREYLDKMRQVRTITRACNVEDKDLMSWRSDFADLYKHWKRTGVMKSPLSQQSVDALNELGVCWGECTCAERFKAMMEMRRRQQQFGMAMAQQASWAGYAMPPAAPWLWPVMFPPVPMAGGPVVPGATAQARAAAAAPVAAPLPEAQSPYLAPRTWNRHVADLRAASKAKWGVHGDDIEESTDVARAPIRAFLREVRRIYQDVSGGGPAVLGPHRLRQIREVMGPEWPGTGTEMGPPGTSGGGAAAVATANGAGAPPRSPPAVVPPPEGAEEASRGPPEGGRGKRKKKRKRKKSREEMESAAMEIVESAKRRWTAQTVTLPA